MLSENLVMLRNLKGLTQEQVAEVVEISRQSYAKWEQGLSVPDSGMLISLAVAGTLLQGFEYFFVRLAPFVFIASVTGIVLTYKKP